MEFRERKSGEKERKKERERETPLPDKPHEFKRPKGALRCIRAIRAERPGALEDVLYHDRDNREHVDHGKTREYIAPRDGVSQERISILRNRKDAGRSDEELEKIVDEEEDGDEELRVEALREWFEKDG